MEPLLRVDVKVFCVTGRGVAFESWTILHPQCTEIPHHAINYKACGELDHLFPHYNVQHLAWTQLLLIKHSHTFPNVILVLQDRRVKLTNF